MELNVLQLFYWFLKCCIVAFAILLSNVIYDQVGWWGIAVLILLMLVGNEYVSRKLSNYKKRSMIARFPFLKELETGNLVTVELKNGETYSNFIYIMCDENEIMISRKMEIGQVLEGQIDNRSIKATKIKSIKKAEFKEGFQPE